MSIERHCKRLSDGEPVEVVKARLAAGRLVEHKTPAAIVELNMRRLCRHAGSAERLAALHSHA